MFKFIVVVLLFLVFLGIQQHNEIALLTDEQKQALITDIESTALHKQQLAEAKEAAHKERTDMLKSTPWSELEPQHYLEKALADELHWWLLVLLLPTLLIIFKRQFDHAARGYH